MKISKVFDHPVYYEIAFSNRNIAREADVFQKFIKKFSKIPVNTVLEIGCGPAIHMPELMKRGYRYIGIDINENMIRAAQQKALESGSTADIYKKDMIDFSLGKKVDFAYILLGSLICWDTKQLISHFKSVAKAIKPGGLYFLDWCVQFDMTPTFFESWKINKNQIQINASYSRKFIDPVGQRFQEIIELNINDKGNSFTLKEKNIRRAIYPQEFILLMEKIGIFDFIGWWNNWDINSPLNEDMQQKKYSKIVRPVIVIRKKL
jgi:ubiquinone/menaquinone biosynthesis C-methylase UbiE